VSSSEQEPAALPDVRTVLYRLLAELPEEAIAHALGQQLPGEQVDQFSQTMQTLAIRIRARRRQLAMSQDHLGKMAGLSRNQVQIIETSRGTVDESTGKPTSANPTLWTICAIADALEVSVTSLLT